jgi:signal transduction histidine kinase
MTTTDQAEMEQEAQGPLTIAERIKAATEQRRDQARDAIIRGILDGRPADELAQVAMEVGFTAGYIEPLTAKIEQLKNEGAKRDVGYTVGEHSAGAEELIGGLRAELEEIGSQLVTFTERIKVLMDPLKGAESHMRSTRQSWHFATHELTIPERNAAGAFIDKCDDAFFRNEKEVSRLRGLVLTLYPPMAALYRAAKDASWAIGRHPDAIG